MNNEARSPEQTIQRTAGVAEAKQVKLTVNPTVSNVVRENDPESSPRPIHAIHELFRSIKFRSINHTDDRLPQAVAAVARPRGTETSVTLMKS